MRPMIKHVARCVAVTVVLTASVGVAAAQIPQVTNPVPPIPQPPPPPPPSMAVPPVPKMDAPPSPPPAPRVDRRSFNQRVTDCLSDTTAARLDGSERAAYSRACAN